MTVFSSSAKRLAREKVVVGAVVQWPETGGGYMIKSRGEF